MHRIVFLLNALLTLPFAVFGLIIPSIVFQGFGIELDAGGEIVARGYATACLGYGAVFLFLRSISETHHIKSLLFSSLLFNLTEVVLQGYAVSADIAKGGVWGTLSAHGIVALISVIAIIRLGNGFSKS